MNIDNIRNDTGSAISTLLTLAKSASSTSTDSTAAPTASSATGAATSGSVSKPGELLAKLSQLLQQDPAKFKQVTSAIADELKTAASNAQGPQAQFLTKLSDDFAQASSSGSLSSLEPPQGKDQAAGAGHARHHGGGHHGGGGAAVGSALSSVLEQVNQALAAEQPGSTTPSSP